MPAHPKTFRFLHLLFSSINVPFVLVLQHVSRLIIDVICCIAMRERERERERKRARERERYVRSRKFESRDHKNPVCDHTERLPKLSLLSVCKCTFHYCKVSLKLNGYTLRGSDFAVFIFAPPPSFLQRGQLIKKRICSYWSKFFSLGVDPFWKSPSFR